MLSLIGAKTWRKDKNAACCDSPHSVTAHLKRCGVGEWNNLRWGLLPMLPIRVNFTGEVEVEL
jgi:hypothetical protein